MNSAILTAVHIANGHTPGNARVLAGYVYDDYVRAPVWYAKATRTTARGNKDPNAGNKDRDEERLARVVRVGLANQIEGSLARLRRSAGPSGAYKRLDAEEQAGDPCARTREHGAIEPRRLCTRCPYRHDWAADNQARRNGAGITVCSVRDIDQLTAATCAREGSGLF
jgi:hypothetical protein